MQRRQVVQATAAAAVAGGASLTSGCAFLFRPSNVKMDVIYDDRACAKTQAPALLVILPGANMAPIELVQQGFVAAVRQQNLAVDVMLPDANLNYVFDGSMMQRVAEDVVGPARAQGYQRIWLAGISLGGFVAMGYASLHPGEIEGLMLMAPYCGRRPLLKEIQEAGGPAQWRRSAKPRNEQDIDHDLWMWLSQPDGVAAGRPSIWLGFGTDDRLAPANEVLAGLLPAAQVRRVPGGHDWPPWRALWAQWLPGAPLPRNCPA
jgi:Serine aminopeptidase, S33